MRNSPERQRKPTANDDGAMMLVGLANCSSSEEETSAEVKFGISNRRPCPALDPQEQTFGCTT
jgi:hypothetical protein